MYANANAAYLESRLYSGDPVELIRILYEAAIAAVEDARHLAAKAIAERSRAINKAGGILAELICSLDRERGGEIAERLGALYGYMHSRLIEANHLQADEPLADVLGLLKTLEEAWQGAKAAPADVPRDAPKAAEPRPPEPFDDYAAPAYGTGSYGTPGAWGQTVPPEASPGYGTHVWSF